MRDTLYPNTEYMRKTNQVSSRLTKNEQRKMLQQTLLIGVGAVALLLTFIFVILPGLARIMVAFLGGPGISGNNDDNLPPQIPIISAPVPATNSAELTLSGYGEAGSELVILLNAAEQSRQKINDDGTFSVPLTLNEGENTIATYSVDSAGNESESGKAYQVLFDDKPPSLTIEEPQNGQNFEGQKNRVITIKGSTGPGVKIHVNQRLVFANNEGIFSTNHQLQDGENTLEIQASDDAGNSTETMIIVNYKP